MVLSILPDEDVTGEFLGATPSFFSLVLRFLMGPNLGGGIILESFPCGQKVELPRIKPQKCHPKEDFKTQK